MVDKTVALLVTKTVVAMVGYLVVLSVERKAQVSAVLTVGRKVQQ